MPDIYGITELGVFHKIKHKLFSDVVKKQCFSLFITKYEEDGRHGLYLLESDDIEQVKQLFLDVISENKNINLSNWKRVL